MPQDSKRCRKFQKSESLHLRAKSITEVSSGCRVLGVRCRRSIPHTSFPPSASYDRDHHDRDAYDDYDNYEYNIK